MIKQSISSWLHQETDVTVGLITFIFLSLYLVIYYGGLAFETLINVHARTEDKSNSSNEYFAELEAKFLHFQHKQVEIL
jgi:hypothetical protein